MHIAFFSPAWPAGESPNGIVTYVAQMRAALRASGHRVTVIAGTTAWPDDGPAVDLAPRPGPARRVWRQLLLKLRGGNGMRQIGETIAVTAARAQRRFGFDLLEMEESFGWSAQVQRRVPVPVVTRLHGPHFLGQVDAETPGEARRSAARCAAEADAIRRATALTSPSARLLETTVAHVGKVEARTRFIPNPIAVDGAASWTVEGCEPGLILCVGRFDRRKGTDIVLKAFVEAFAGNPDLRLLLVGPDTGIRLADGSLLHFGDYADRFVPADARAAIEFRGVLPPDEIAPLRQKAFLTLVGSRFENFPYSVAEAMAAGCPIVATDVFGNGEMIQHDQTGWLVANENWRAMAGIITRAIASPMETTKVAAAGRRRCQEVYAADLIANDSLAFYREVVGDFGRSRQRE